MTNNRLSQGFHGLAMILLTIAALASDPVTFGYGCFALLAGFRTSQS